MKVPINWLKEYVDVDLSPEELADKLTFSGIEVEGINVVGGDYKGIIVGEVVSVEPHPEADKLKLCKVNTGSNEVSLVCGAENVQQGLKVVFAGVGTCLEGQEPIKEATIRGETSCGMLCSERELGISDDHSGVMIVPDDVSAGTPFSEVMGESETVLHLEVTWNRPDCLGMIGIAREVAALTGKELKLPSVDVLEEGDPVEDMAKVIVEDKEGCPRYMARVLSGVQLGPSPMWMRKRLMLSGIRPINNIVDITNYVLLESGQPLHAFDHEFLTDATIVVRRARAGEKMSTLDGVERSVTPEMLLIADAKVPVALAGVMGGQGSEIGESTNRVLLESACFDAAGVHRTSFDLALSTESSHRFARGVDISMVDWASRRAAALAVDLTGAVLAKGCIDVYEDEYQAKRILCRMKKFRDLLGIDLDLDVAVSILESIGLAVEDKTDDTFVIAVPSFRRDLTIEADIVEEVARMHGLDKIPENVPRAMIVPGVDDAGTRACQACRRNLIGLGLTEVIHYSFMASELIDELGLDPNEQRVILPNPVSEDHGALRNSLIPQVLETLALNMSRQVKDAAVFEIGRVFWNGSDGVVCEEDRLCIGLMGNVGRTGLGRAATSADDAFLWLKGLVSSLCEAQKVEVSFVPSPHKALDARYSVDVILDGEASGILGAVNGKVCSSRRMDGCVAVAEMPLERIIRHMFEVPELKPVPAYPAITRDMALLVGQDVVHEDVMGIIRKSAPPELTSIDLFDIFTGKGVGRGKRSLAYSLVYRSLERTLTDKEANEYHEAIKEALKSELNVEIR
jgi:phenylalanyl-tRNA synthetase beta chain